MQTHQYQLTLYLPDDANQVAVASPKNDAPPPKALSIREAAHLYTCKIKDLPVAEQPISRLQHYGTGMLNTSELLAIILGAQYVADADHILGEAEGLPGLAAMTFAELMALPAVGEVTAARIKVAFELGRRLLVAAPAERPVVRSPADAANLLMAEMSLLDQEELRIILLDTRNRILAIETLYRGNLNSSAVRVGEVFKGAIRRNAAAIILCHNHPSSDPSPSPDDVQVTRMIVEAGKLLAIDVLDHLVLSRQKFVSLKERGLGFS